ncbi:MAG: TonB-dependent receptor [Pseudomonadota bacterium]
MSKKILLKTSALAFALQGAMALSTSFSAIAQDQDDTADEARTLNTITVTSRKQEESILDIPVAVTAFDAAKIEDLGLTDLVDLQDFTPGFTYESFGTTTGRLDNVPRFRGVTTNTANPTRQTASVFIDGVFVANGVQGINFNDIERIEAIKGPQSAFFGRSTFGGAINFITRTPGDELRADISASATSRSLYEISGGIEGPLIGDWLKGRLSANFRDKEGHYDSTADGGSTGDEETWSIAGTLFITPSNNFDAKLRVNYFENDDGSPAVGIVGQDLLNCGPTAFETEPNFPSVVPGQRGPLGGEEAFFCGELPSPDPNIPTIASDGLLTALGNLETPVNGSNARRADKGFGLDRKSLRLSGQFTYEIPNTGLTISSITGLNEEEVNQLRVGEGNNLGPPAFISFNSREFKDFSQEVRLAGTALGDRLDWSIGANYFDQEFNSSGGFGTLGGFLFGNGSNLTENQIETIGIFGSLDYQLTDKLGIAVEGRFQEDDITEGADSATFDSFLPRVILNYQPDNQTLIYVSYSEGNLPGGFNTDLIELSDADQALVRAIQPFSSETFDEEVLKNTEIGVKRDFADGSGFVAAAAYYMDRTEQTYRDTTQVTLTDGTDDFITQFLNIGRSEIYGLEIEGVWSPIENLTLDASLSYTDATFTDFESANALRVFGRADISGNEAERAPQLTGSFSWLYEDQLENGWTWYIRNDNSYQDHRYASEVNLARTDVAMIHNLRVGVRNDRYRVEAFGLNLSDSDSPIAAVRSTDLGSVVTRTNGARPFDFLIGLRDRSEYGVRISANF